MSDDGPPGKHMTGADEHITELEAALRPFAMMVAFISRGADDEELIIMALKPEPNATTDPWQSQTYTPPMPVTVGAVRRAAALIGLQAKLEGKIDSDRVAASRRPPDQGKP